MRRLGQKYLQSVQRAIDVVKYIAENQEDGVTLNDISKKFSKTPSTMVPILNTLIYAKLIQVKNKRYRLSPEILRLSFCVSSNISVKSVAHKYLEKIAHELEGNAHLGLLSEMSVIYVDRVVNSPRGYTYSNIIGMVASGYRTGLGKALIAFQGDNFIREYLSREKFEKVTPYTITDPDELLEEFKRARRDGYALDRQESTEGVSCVAVPILSCYPCPCYSVSIALPHSRFLENFDSIVKTMTEVAEKIGEEMRRLEA